MMYPGEKPSFVLYLKNGTAQTQDLRVETLVKDYQGKVFAKLPPLQVKLPAAKEVQTTFEAPASKEPNHYILYMAKKAVIMAIRLYLFKVFSGRPMASKFSMKSST